MIKSTRLVGYGNYDYKASMKMGQSLNEDPALVK